MKRKLAIVVSLALTAAMTVPVFAAVADPVAGETTVGIQVYDYDPANLAKSVSFTVPMYVTLAVTKDAADTADVKKSKIIVPAADAYNITNTTAAGGSAIAVTQLVVSDLNAAATEWALVSGTPAGANNIAMSLGTSTNKLDLTATTFTTGGFVTATNAKPADAAKITPQGKLQLDIAAAIDTAQEYDAKAATPQFKLAYTLQPLKADGTYVKASDPVTYVGDDKGAAGYPVTP